MPIDQAVIHYASPALCGIKPANLLSLSAEEFEDGLGIIERFNEEFLDEEKFIKPIPVSTNRVLIFIYNKRILEAMISSGSGKKYLEEKNYPVELGIQAVLEYLFKKLSPEGNKNFPHEVGFFLGYPVEDVILFEKNYGRGSKFTGSWKVYGNVKESGRLMENYRKCTEYCTNLFCSGKNFREINKTYNEFRMEEAK